MSLKSPPNVVLNGFHNIIIYYFLKKTLCKHTLVYFFFNFYLEKYFNIYCLIRFKLTLRVVRAGLFVLFCFY